MIGLPLNFLLFHHKTWQNWGENVKFPLTKGDILETHLNVIPANSPLNMVKL